MIRRKFDVRSVIRKHFPGTTFTANYLGWQVEQIIGNKYENEDLQNLLAKTITKIKTEEEASNKPEVLSENSEENSLLQGILEEYGSSTDSTTTTNFAEPRQIKLITPSYAKVELFPQSFHCRNCNYFEIGDITKKKNWLCPSCKNGNLQQVTQIFNCSICGDIRPINPNVPNNEKTPSYQCPTHENGKIFLDMQGRGPGSWKWICSETGDSHENVGFVGTKCWNCSKRLSAEKNETVNIKMRMAAVSSNLLRPLIIDTILFGDEDNEEPLESLISKIVTSNNFSNDETKKLFSDFKIDHIEKFEKVHSVSAIFGYSGKDENVKVNLFDRIDSRTKERVYQAYVEETTGKGILIHFDKSKILKLILQKLSETTSNDDEKIKQYLIELESNDDEKIKEIYSWICKKTKIEIEQDGKTENILFNILHTLEHALSINISLQTGLEEESFGGKIILEKCAVLIYETKDVASGGIDFLLENENILENWLIESQRSINNCNNACEDGCPKCLFYMDHRCHPLWTKEFPNRPYIYPNDLFSKTQTQKFLNE